MRAQLISWLKSDITPAVRQSRNPEAELLKFATAQNLPPAQLEALAQLYNTAATVAYLDKASVKGASFHIVQVPPLLDEYLKVRPTEAKSATVMADTWENLGVLGDIGSLPKCFAGLKGMKATFDGSPDDCFEVKIARVVSSRETERLDSERGVVIEQGKQALFNLGEDLREELEKVSRVFRVWDPPAFDALESDALLQHGPTIKCACDHAAKWLTDAGVAVKRAAGPGGRRLVQDHEMLSKFARLKDLLEWRQQIQDEVGGLEKEAAQAATSAKEKQAPAGYPDTQTGHSSQKQPGQSGKGPSSRGPIVDGGTQVQGIAKNNDLFGGEGSWIRDKAPEQAEKTFGELSTGLDSMTDRNSVIGKLFRERFEEVVGERNNRGQKLMDEGAGNARRQAVIQQLLLTDPVLSEADPEHVMSLYNSLTQAMPDVAGDPNVMRMALRSAIQHDGISPFDLKQMTDTQTAGQQQGLNRRVLDAVDYKALPLAIKQLKK